MRKGKVRKQSIVNLKKKKEKVQKQSIVKTFKKKKYAKEEGAKAEHRQHRG